MKFVLITSCSVSRNFPPLVKVADIPRGTMSQCLDWWVEQLKEHSKKKSNLKTPGELYTGIAYNVITEMAQVIGHDNVYIVTGGQGLIALTHPIVPYDFTSDKKADENIWKQVKGEKFVPTVWWEQINTRMGRSATPVADLLRDPKVIVLGALTKGFIKYIVRDLSSVETSTLEERVFIPISRSMLTSFPASVRSAFVPYEQEFAEGVDYTRYDKPHKITQRLLGQMQEGLRTGKTPAQVAQNVIEESRMAAARRVVSGQQSVDYDKLFEQYPDVLKCETPEQAIKLLKVFNAPYGGKHRFAAAWRGAKGQIQVDAVPKSLQDKALSALSAIVTSSANGTPVKNDDAELLQRCGLFVKLMRDNFPGTPFTAAMVSQWGRDTYGEEDTSGITSAVKLAYVLEYNAKYLGIEVLKGNGKIMFRVEGQ